MQVITESMTKVVLEITKEEIHTHGFDQIWSEVRASYPKNEYEIFSIDNKPNEDDLFYIELIPNALMG